MLKRIGNFCCRHKKPILIIIIFFIPLVLASPFPIPPWHSKKISTELEQDGQIETKNYLLPISSKDALGTSLLSRLLSIKMESMPGYICIRNDSEAYFDDQKLDPRDFLDGKNGGAISVTLIYNDVPSPIYIPYGSSTCHNFDKEKGLAELRKNIEVRGILPFGRPEVHIDGTTTTVSVMQYSRSEVVFKMSLENGYDWRWSTYFKNYFLSLFAFIIILASIFQVWDKTFKKDTPHD